MEIVLEVHPDPEFMIFYNLKTTFFLELQTYSSLITK